MSPQWLKEGLMQIPFPLINATYNQHFPMNLHQLTHTQCMAHCEKLVAKLTGIVKLVTNFQLPIPVEHPITPPVLLCRTT
jgi:hypothetical protein